MTLLPNPTISYDTPIGTLYYSVEHDTFATLFEVTAGDYPEARLRTTTGKVLTFYSRNYGSPVETTSLYLIPFYEQASVRETYPELFI